ncbi:hypothetical protein [Bartonella sp. OT172YNZD]|uniref:virion core protein, T7 gp14 family n=1 Tax=Bartonella sp. OT172YNZD TaxID=3243572 RepID=UPI0035CF57DD
MSFGVGGILSLFGVGINAIGAYTQAKQQQYQFQSQALSYAFDQDMAKINAKMLESQAMQLYRAGRLQAMQYGMKAGQVQGSAKAHLAANGVKAGVGSAAEILATTELMKEIDLLTINSNTVQAVEAKHMQKMGVEMSGTIAGINATRARANVQSINPLFAGVTTFLGGSARIFANEWYRGNGGY